MFFFFSPVPSEMHTQHSGPHCLGRFTLKWDGDKKKELKEKTKMQKIIIERVPTVTHHLESTVPSARMTHRLGVRSSHLDLGTV